MKYSRVWKRRVNFCEMRSNGVVFHLVKQLDKTIVSNPTLFLNGTIGDNGAATPVAVVSP